MAEKTTELQAKTGFYVASKELAPVLGVTGRRVEQLVADGVLIYETQGRRRQFDVGLNARAYIDYLKARFEKRPPASQQENLEAKLAAEVRIKEARAEVAEIELKELRGMMYRGDDIERLTNELVFSVRAMLLSIPSRCCIDLSELNNPNEVSAYLSKVVAGLLTELSQHEYSQEKYLELIHEREGLIAEVEDVDDDDGE